MNCEHQFDFFFGVCVRCGAEMVNEAPEADLSVVDLVGTSECVEFNNVVDHFRIDYTDDAECVEGE